MEINTNLNKVINSIYEKYEKPVEQIGNLSYRMDKEIQQEVSYMMSEYTGEYEGDLQWRMFLNIVNQFVDVELRATAIKMKAIEVMATDEDYVFSMIVEKELKEEFDNLNMANLIRDWQKQKRVHGNGIFTVNSDEKEYLEVPDISIMILDPRDLDGGRKLQPYTLRFDELEEKRGAWDDESIDELIFLAEKVDDQEVMIEDIEGLIKPSLIGKELEDGEKDTYQLYRLVVGVSGEKRFLLDSYPLDEKQTFVFWRERRPANYGGKGIGIVREVVNEQIAINESVIARQEAEAITSKVGVRTNKRDLPGVLQLNNGFVIDIDTDKNEFYDPVTFDAPQVNFQNTIDAIFQNAQRKVSVFEANSGEELKAGATFAGTALQNANASSYFDYLRGIDADDLVFVIEEIIMKRMAERISKEHKLNASYSPKQLAIIDEYFINEKYNDWLFDNFMNGQVPDPFEAEEKLEKFNQEQRKKGSRRSVYVPAGVFTLDNIKKKTRTIISNEQDDVQERINTLLATMNQMSPEDPARLAMQQEVMELSGTSPINYLSQSASGDVKQAQVNPTQEKIQSFQPEGQQ